MPIEIKDEWRKAAVDAGSAVCSQHTPCNEWLDAALEAVAPLIAEECAKIAKALADAPELTDGSHFSAGYMVGCNASANAIRARAAGKKDENDG